MRRFLIVGQGLAGTFLAHEFEKRNIDFLVVDPESANSASSVSSGLINPITGRRYVKTWMIEDLLKVSVESYKEMEEILSLSLVKHVDIIRSLSSIKDENVWNSQLLRPGYESFMGSQYTGPDYSTYLDRTHAFGTVKRGMMIAVAEMIAGYRNRLKTHGRLIEAHLNYKDLTTTDHEIIYQGQSFDGILFAEGWGVLYNPWFKYLDFRPAKGEVLICRIPGFPSQAVIKHRKFFVPLKDDFFWVGSTYKWQFENNHSDPEMKDQLIQYLDEILKLPYEIVRSQTGVRPATKFRRPFVGSHPKFPRFHILNGLGTKGVSLAPFWALALVSRILNEPFELSSRFADLPIIK